MEVGNNITLCNDENTSDDEIFFGKMTLKEAKKLIFMNYPARQTISCTASNEEHFKDESVRIIETHSEPDLVVVDNSLDCDLKAVSSPNIICEAVNGSVLEVKPDDSFIRLEKMVSELCMSPADKHPQLDNTLEVVDFILNNVEQNKYEDDHKVLPCLDDINLNEDKKTEHLQNILDNYNNTANVQDAINLDHNENKNNIKYDPDMCVTPKCKVENSCKIKVCNTENVECPVKINTNNNRDKIKCDTVLLTPNNKNNANINHMFKTPKNPVSSKKPVTSTKKTPNRLNQYQHITSPIASYIKNCPQVPLVKDVHPQRPLPPKSSIPQSIKSVSKATNKENIQFPSVAYKSAKKTQMVSVPSQEKMPKGEWTNKLTSKLKKPVVITHGQRVASNVVKNLSKRQEDSFANLTLQQADLSVCIKKSAF